MWESFIDLPIIIGLSHDCDRLTIDKTVCGIVCPRIKPLLLLFIIIHNDCQKTFSLDTDQSVQSVLNGICYDLIKVSADTSKLIPKFFTNLLYWFYTVFDEFWNSTGPFSYKSWISHPCCSQDRRVPSTGQGPHLSISWPSHIVPGLWDMQHMQVHRLHL